MKTEAPPPVQSIFWTASYRFVKIYSTFIWIAGVGIIFSYTSDIKNASKPDPFVVLALVFLLIFFIASNAFAISGFYRRKNGHKKNWPLVVYVAIQTIFFVISVDVIVLYLLKIWIHNAGSPSVPRLSVGDFIDTAIALIILIVVSLPLCLVVYRSIWARIVKPPPLIDAAGKYMNCASCGYDLRGTPGPTCPECGASVMTDKPQGE